MSDNYDYSDLIRRLNASGLTQTDKNAISEFADMHTCIIHPMTAHIQVSDIGGTRPNDPIYISLAKPMDAGGMFEIALLDKIGGSIIYNDDLDYSDICRFDTLEDVQAEISRLARL